MSAGFDDLAQLGIDAFDGIGGVDHLAYRLGKNEERYNPVPVPVPGPAPGSRDRGVLLAPGAGAEIAEQTLYGLIMSGMSLNAAKALLANQAFQEQVLANLSK